MGAAGIVEGDPLQAEQFGGLGGGGEGDAVFVFGPSGGGPGLGQLALGALGELAQLADLNAAKRARVPDGASITFDSRPFACPRVATTPFVLTPGDTPGKAAGLTFLIGPYQAGPYAEGGYEIAVPSTVFRSLLATAYAGEFGGKLAREGDVSPALAPEPTV